MEAAGLGVTGAGAETVIKDAPDLVIRGLLGEQGEPGAAVSNKSCHLSLNGLSV